MATSTVPPPTEHVASPSSTYPPSQNPAKSQDGSKPRKTKAAKAFRSLIGMFQKSGRKGSEKTKESPLTSPALNERMTDLDFLSSPGSSEEDYTSSGTDISGKDVVACNYRNGMGSSAKPTYDILTYDCSGGVVLVGGDGVRGGGGGGRGGNDVPVTGNHRELQQQDEVDEGINTCDDVFLNESYFEDNYLDDFSGGSSSPDELPFPVECAKGDKQRRKHRRRGKEEFAAERELIALMSWDLNSSLKRHASMPCLSKLTSLSNPELPVCEEPPKEVGHLLQNPEQYLTFGIEVVNDYFGEDKNDFEMKDNFGEDKNDFEMKDNFDEDEIEQYTPRRSLSRTTSRNSSQSSAPTKEDAIISSNFEEKASMKGVSDLSRDKVSKNSFKSYASKVSESEPTTLDEIKPANPAKAENSVRVRKVADLSAVADWLKHVVAMNDGVVSNSTDVKESVVSNSTDVKESVVSNSTDVKETVVSNSTDVKESVVSNSTDVKESVVSNSTDVKESVATNSTEVKESVVSNTTDAAKIKLGVEIKNSDQDGPAGESFCPGAKIPVESLDNRTPSVLIGDPRMSPLHGNQVGQSDLIATDTNHPRLESGYISRSRCSSGPMTPLSEPSTPMLRLKSGKFLSPQSLNKLDGINPREADQGKQPKNQKFLFPPSQSYSLNAVAETNESSRDSWTNSVDHSRKSPLQIPGDADEIIISSGGDVDSLMTSASHLVSASSTSGSVYWSALSSMPNDRQGDASIDGFDNNVMTRQSPQAQPPTADLPEVPSPSVQRLQPISSSSPLQLPAPPTYVWVANSNQKRESATRPSKLSPKVSHRRHDPESNVQGEMKAALAMMDSNPRPIVLEKRRKSWGSRSARSARTCLRFDERDTTNNSSSNGGSKVAVGKPSKDYLLLKQVATFVMDIADPKIGLKSYANVPSLMESLTKHYARIVDNYDSCTGILKLSNLKLVVEKDEALVPLTTTTCVDRFLLDILKLDKSEINNSADFIFRNLPSVVKANSSFFSLAPELVALLLSNDHCVVRGPNGFPLPYRNSEKEVLKATVRYVEQCHQENRPDVDRIHRLLYQVIDATVVIKDVFSVMARSEKGKESPRVPKASRPRKRHTISYYRSDRVIADASETIKSSQKAESDPSPEVSSHIPIVASLEDHMTLFELSKYGTINVEAPVDVNTICDEEHVLKTLYFCYTSLNGLPYIIDIGMQYVTKRKKRILFVTSPSKHQRASSSSTPEVRRSDKSMKAGARAGSKVDSKAKNAESKGGEGRARTKFIPVSEQEHPFTVKKAALVLLSGEHITAISVLGHSAVHNVEVLTSTGRRVRAHGLATDASLGWTKIQAPACGPDSPLCLHAVVGETSPAPNEMTSMSRIGAVWAVASWRTNDLGR